MRYKRYGRFCAVLHLMDKIEHFIITIDKALVHLLTTIYDANEKEATFVVSKSHNIPRCFIILWRKVLQRLTK